MSQPTLPPDAAVLQLAFGRWVSQSLGVAARLGIADLLSSGEHNISDLARSAGTQTESLYRLLRALASVGVFSESSTHAFSNTPLSDTLRSDTPNSMRNMCMMVNDPWQ